VRNYFNYFTEIEERFQQRRGSLLLLSTLDWALIEAWRDAGVPLPAVLRGIDAAFDKHDAAKARRGMRKVNGLAWCAQAVMEEAEQMAAASVGAAPASEPGAAAENGFEPERIARHLSRCADQLKNAALPAGAAALGEETAARLAALAAELRAGSATEGLEALERTLSVLEERLLQLLLATGEVEVIVALREQAARELAPYRSRMGALQIRQIEAQFLSKRLLDHYRVPRWSLFYMGAGE
jgi:hypothetical protein